ncbi:D-alanine--D-alanine ligase [bacterium]|nr:D-alanine--D-alanine ligase [bacterium]
MARMNLAVVFGAKSPEHDVSIVTTLQAWPWINKDKYYPYLIYLDPQNQAYLCPSPEKYQPRVLIKKTLERNIRVEFIHGGFLMKKGVLRKKVPLDCALLILHGSYGEDGRIQGMLDFLEIPYTGSGVLGSALGMDKVAMKDIFVKLGLPVTPYLWFWYQEFKKDPARIKKLVKKKLKYPLYVKPANAGSSIGITRIKTEKKLAEAIKKAARYDYKILLEQEIERAVDINCAVMGGWDPIVSPCEQPITTNRFFSFQEKYLKGGKKKGLVNVNRIIPAPIPDKVTVQIQEMAKLIFKELGCWGMARMDFLYQEKTKTAYPNEINTIPGSLAFYLWEAGGIKPSQLIDKMVKLALERSREIAKLDYSFQSPLLDQK